MGRKMSRKLIPVFVVGFAVILGICYKDKLAGMIAPLKTTTKSGRFARGTESEKPSVNNCKPDTCQNRGRCVSHAGGFHCDCAEGYQGQRCENEVVADVIDCTKNPCINGGTCSNIGNAQNVCRCEMWFTGPQCESVKCDIKDIGKASKEHETAVKIALVNKTNRVVLVYWVDYSGAEVKHAPIEVGEVTEVHTYLTHVFRVRDEQTGTLLTVDGECEFTVKSIRQEPVSVTFR